jgi:DNA-binding NarL/FixJ family response regulator
MNQGDWMQELTVVLVEDSMTIRRQILQRLRSVHGLRVVGEAPDEPLALALVAATRPDAVLLDLSLADGGSGLQVLKQLRRQGYAGQVHVLSHQTPETYRAACVAAGANGFFDKAEELDALLKALAGGAEPQPVAPFGRDEFLVRLDQSALLAQRDGGDLTLQVWRRAEAEAGVLAQGLLRGAEAGDLVGMWRDGGQAGDALWVVAHAVPEEADPAGEMPHGSARLPEDGFSGEALLARALLGK